MTYLAQESSLSDGSPVELFTITYSNNQWFYTSGDSEVVLDNKTYVPIAITRDSVQVTTEYSNNEFNIIVPLDLPILDLYRVTSPSGIVTVLCQRYHRTDVDQELAMVFKGSIINVQWEIDNAVISCESSSQTIKRMGLRENYQYGCPYMLYGPGCNVSPASYTHTGTASNIAGSTMSVTAISGQPDNIFGGGYIQYLHNQLGTVERVSIVSSNGSTGALELFNIPVGLANGDPVDVLEGCDRSALRCRIGFNNIENYGGKSFMPTKNPFDGTPLF